MEEGEEVPLSYGQQRLWFVEQLEPHNGAYLLSQSYGVGRGVEVERLEESLGQVVRRQGSLRTRFEERAGEVVQRIGREEEGRVGRLRVVEMSGLGKERERREGRRDPVSN